MARGVDSGKSPARQVGRGNPLNPGHYTPQPSTSPAPNPGKTIYESYPVGGQKRAVPAGAAVSRVGPANHTPTVQSEASRQKSLFGERVGTEDDGGRGANNHLPHEIAHNNPGSRAYTQRQAPISGTGQHGDFYGAKPEVIQLAQMRVNTEKALPSLLTGDSNKARPASKLVDTGMRVPDAQMSPHASEVKVSKGTKSQVESAFAKQQRTPSIEIGGRVHAGVGPTAPAISRAEAAAAPSTISARPARRVERQFSNQNAYASQAPKTPKPLGGNTGGVLGRATGSMTRNTLKPGNVPKDKGISSRKP